MTAEGGDKGHPTDLSVLHLVLAQMAQMEGRLRQAIMETDAASRDRWSAHRLEHEEITGRLDRLHDHVKDDALSRAASEARMGPVRRVTAILIREWRTLALGILILFNFAEQVINHPR